jgi:hypothetical protein
MSKLNFFINFKPENIAYGGGNVFALNLIEYLKKNDINVIFELNEKIDIFFIIDPHKGPFKKYSLDEIVNYKKKINKGKIIIRINDCDKTRPNVTQNRSREFKIMQFYQDIDLFIFNSNFIKNYYMNKYNQLNNINYDVIYNGGNDSILKPKDNYSKPKCLKIVTHHWSDNINKGYDTYYKLHKFFENRTDYEFIFVGRKFNDNYKNVPVVGPYKGKELADYLRSCDIYITDSKYDSCPMHVVEGILSGLPILYTSCEGGGKNLCELPNDKIGESFDDFPDLIDKIEKINHNYQFYRSNVLKNITLYNNYNCMDKYLKKINSLY